MANDKPKNAPAPEAGTTAAARVAEYKLRCIYHLLWWTRYCLAASFCFGASIYSTFAGHPWRAVLTLAVGFALFGLASSHRRRAYAVLP